MKPPRTLPIDKGPVTQETLRNHLDQVSKVLSNISHGTAFPPAPTAGQHTAISDPTMNVAGQKFIVTSPATPNTEFAINHTLGYIPTGWQYRGGSNPGVVYRSTTPWTATQIFLKETQGTNTFVIIIE